MAEIIRDTTEYPNGHYQNYTRPFDTSISREKERIFVFNRVHAVMFMVMMIICSVLIASNLLIQQETAQADIALKNYEANISTLQAHTDTIYNKISDQYNYQVIKNVAKEGNLEIASSRVRSVE